MKITKTVYEEIRATLGTLVPERGGVLGSRDGETVDAFFFDESGAGTPDAYTPDHERINGMLEREWEPAGIGMVGMIHSHRPTCTFPSCGDLFYAHAILHAAPALQTLRLPIVTAEPFRIHAYAVSLRDGRPYVCREEVEIVPDAV